MAAMLVSIGVAQAVGELDVSILGSDGTINGAWFHYCDPSGSTGTGIFDPFLSIDPVGPNSGGIWELGYNFDYSSSQPALYDEVTGGDRTHTLLLSTVPKLWVDTTGDGLVDDLYREFRIDVNQSGNAPLTLDTLKIYQSSDDVLDPLHGPLYGYDSSTGLLGGVAPIYDMGDDDWVRMAGQHGSGSGDMRVLILDSLFDPAKPYVQMYSVMGDVPWTLITDPNRFEYASNDGFEEWGVITGDQPPTPLIPEGSSILLALSSLPTVGMLGWLRRKRQSG